MPKYTLTRRQAEVLDYIEEYTTSHGFPPSGRELAAACRLGSPSGAHRMIVALEKKGFIERSPGLSRGLSVVLPAVDYSGIGLEDFAKISAMAAMQAISRDSELSAAALQDDPSTKEMLIELALVRHRRVTALARRLADFPRELDVSGYLGDFKAARAEGVQHWPTFVVDHLLWNLVSVEITESLVEVGPTFRAIIWPNAQLARRTADQAEVWLADILDHTDDTDLSRLQRRASAFIRILWTTGAELDRVFAGGQMMVSRLFDDRLVTERLGSPVLGRLLS